MAQDSHHGVRIKEINEGTLTITTVSTAIVRMSVTLPAPSGGYCNEYQL